MSLSNRFAEECLTRLLASHPVVVVHGARQTGKSTLVRDLAPGRGRAFRTLDALDVLLQAQQHPEALFTGTAPVTIDEVQRAPELMLAIKRAVDLERIAGRFLVTGSSDLLLGRHVADSLAGRAVYLRLAPMTQAELAGTDCRPVIDALLGATTATEALYALPARPQASRPQETWAAGGYPVPAQEQGTRQRDEWFDGYLQTYVERDVRQQAAIQELMEFRRVMRLAALQCGGLTNLSSLARDAGISQATATRWLNLLEITFQVRRVPAYSVNRSRRLIKAPKLYWTDVGMWAHVAGLAPFEPGADPRAQGVALETLVLHHLQVWCDTRSPRSSVCHWRTASGFEVDLVLETQKRVQPIEVKATAHPRSDDLRGLNAFLDEYPAAPLGVLACSIEEPRLLSSRVLGLPIERLLVG